MKFSKFYESYTKYKIHKKLSNYQKYENEKVFQKNT